MSSIIEHLTDAQLACIPEFIHKWTEIGACTDRSDRPRAEAGINLEYRNAGFDVPQQIVWCESPVSAGATREQMLSRGESVGENLREEFDQSGFDSLSNALSDCVSRQIQDFIDERIRSETFTTVHDNITDMLRRTIRSQWTRKCNTLSQRWGNLYGANYGQHEAGLLAKYVYFAEVCELPTVAQYVAGRSEIAQSANWWIPHERICFACERPHILHRDENARLHCEDGPALSYADGFSVWAIHGVLVDEQVVMHPETQSLDQIAYARNEEQRRIRIDRFGWPRYLAESGATVISARRNDVDGTEERLMRLKNGSCRLLCSCRSTGRIYAIGVPRDVATCEEAQHWMVGGSSVGLKLGNCLGAS